MTTTDRAADASLREWARDRLIDEREQLREQNKALLEALRRYVDTDGYHDDITVQGEAAIAQAEQRGGSRADGPLLRGPIACSACSGKVVIADWGTCALCGLKQQAYPSSEEKANA